MKKQWDFNDYIVVVLIVLFIIGSIHSCSKEADKGRQAEIEAAYTEGYENGYYDGENGNPYKNVR